MFNFLFAMFIAGAVNGQSFVPVQTGSYQGLLTTGLGHQTDSYITEATLGWSPNLNSRPVYQLNLKAAKFLSPRIYAGLGLLATTDPDTFLQLPEQYPDRYYAPTGLHFAPYVGWTEDNFFVEIATLDYYLDVKVRNPNYAQWQEIISLGFGYRISLDK